MPGGMFHQRTSCLLLFATQGISCQVGTYCVIWERWVPDNERDGDDQEKNILLSLNQANLIVVRVLFYYKYIIY